MKESSCKELMVLCSSTEYEFARYVDSVQIWFEGLSICNHVISYTVYCISIDLSLWMSVGVSLQPEPAAILAKPEGPGWVSCKHHSAS